MVLHKRKKYHESGDQRLSLAADRYRMAAGDHNRSADTRRFVSYIYGGKVYQVYRGQDKKDKRHKKDLPPERSRLYGRQAVPLDMEKQRQI